MKNYNAVWREPHVFEYKNLNIIHPTVDMLTCPMHL